MSWKGRLLLDLDGTTLMVPDSDENRIGSACLDPGEGVRHFLKGVRCFAYRPGFDSFGVRSSHRTAGPRFIWLLGC